MWKPQRIATTELAIVGCAFQHLAPAPNRKGPQKAPASTHDTTAPNLRQTATLQAAHACVCKASRRARLVDNSAWAAGSRQMLVGGMYYRRVTPAAGHSPASVCIRTCARGLSTTVMGIAAKLAHRKPAGSQVYRPCAAHAARNTTYASHQLRIRHSTSVGCRCRSPSTAGGAQLRVRSASRMGDAAEVGDG